MQNFSGLIISSARTLERNASSEIYYILTEILELKEVKSDPIKGISGLSLASFSEDSVDVLKRIKNELEKDPSVLQFALKLVPIQYKISSNLENLRLAGKLLNEKITDDVKWRINLRRRHTQIKRDDVISNIAFEINKGKVSLNEPDLYIIVEMVGKWIYLAISDMADLAITSYNLDEDIDDFTFELK